MVHRAGLGWKSFVDLLLPSLSEMDRNRLPRKVTQQVPKPQVGPRHTGLGRKRGTTFHAASSCPQIHHQGSQFVCLCLLFTTVSQTKPLSPTWINLLFVSFLLPAQKPEDMTEHHNSFTVTRELGESRSAHITAYLKPVRIYLPASVMQAQGLLNLSHLIVPRCPWVSYTSVAVS